MTRRLIDSTISQSTKWNSLDKDYYTRILYILLIAHADPHGRGDADAIGIKLRVMQGFCESPDEIVKSLFKLDKAGLIKYYEVDEKRFYEISQWNKFQNFNAANRGFASKFPEPPENHSESLIITKEIVGFKEVEVEKEVEFKKPDGAGPKKSAVTQRAKIDFDFQTGQFKNITPEHIKRWKEAYPAVDVEGEIKRLACWLMANPSQKKSNYERFFTNNLSRKQDQGWTRYTRQSQNISTGKAPKPTRPSFIPTDPEEAERLKSRAAENMRKLTGKGGDRNV